ncbi:MAG: NAD(P)H-hydrate dehydratase [Chitinophagaceae bacterium]|nr:NAD(P)H-hydrate dehydratase [Chitinophagaceae bacterium]
MKKLTEKFIARIYKPRSAESHKGDYGHALIIAGGKDKSGAALIATRACLRSGAGLVSTRLSNTDAALLLSGIPEAMLYTTASGKIDTARFNAIGMGPGLGTGRESVSLVNSVIAQKPENLVIDADALNVISFQDDLWQRLPANTILTPHSKEFDRLFGDHANRTERIKTALSVSKKFPLVIVLKGHLTLVAFDGKGYTNTTGNAGLAKGGSGDALTGMITAFAAQGYAPLQAAQLAVYLHGAAADLTLACQSEESMLITDVIENLGRAFRQLSTASI